MGRGGESEYLLMNRDAPVLRFLCRRNVFDEPEFYELERVSDALPIGYRNLEQFLSHRKAPKHRAHMQELLRRAGCEDLEGFIRVAHALSLNDTFWVREADSSLRWADVSLYRNDFDDLISRAAFSGEFSSEVFSSTSPEFATDGSYAKCWVREGREIFLYKSGTALNEIEPFSEFFASQIAEILCEDSVKYDLRIHHGSLVSSCPLFTSEETGFAKISQIFHSPAPMPALLEYFEKLGSGDAFRRMCVLDALILDPDRHYGNFGVLFDNAGLQALKMAPVFDHNRSLFPELSNDKLADPSWYLEKCAPRLGQDFVLTARVLLTDTIRTDLKNFSGFHFSQHSRICFPQERLDRLDRIVADQIRRILE